MKRLLAFLLVGFALNLYATNAQVYKATSDTLTTLLCERANQKGRVTVNSVKESRKGITVNCGATLKDFPWTAEDVEWFKEQLHEFLPSKFRNKKIIGVTAGGTDLGKLYNYPKKRKYKDERELFLEEVGGPFYSKGLSGRNISMWQSHGMYFDEKSDRWLFQRAPVFTTVEDLYTQSYVNEFLMPMLENAGAYILDPRERSTQTAEVVCDNDPGFGGERPEGVRLEGAYSEQGAWADAGVGFADTLMYYIPGENPFRAGTSRKAVVERSRKATASATWSFSVPESGIYPVYVAYNTYKNSSPCAHYTLTAADGEREFVLNQSECGAMWTYIGSFQFLAGNEYRLTLDNSTPAGHRFEKGNIVSADAVRIGGGMGKFLRGKEGADRDMLRTSGLSSFVEGAYYSMLWGGCDPEMFKWEGDYTKDYAGRGVWTKSRGIPVDLSLAFHTDAGTTEDDSIIGTLAIYTYKDDGNVTKYSDGNDRIQGRHLTELIQNEVVADIRDEFEPDWRRRMLWDKSYSESRTTGVPAMLMELLSHQNFADMRYGLDPSFRFTVSRAVYKGMVKFLSEYYGGIPYVIQPLPVNSFNVKIVSRQAVLEWKETEDRKEPSAKADEFLVQTRAEDGVWSKPEVVKAKKSGEWYSVMMPLQDGILSSFRVIAQNKGGRSFPSEVLCAGVPDTEEERTVLVVNNFTRVAAPAWHDYGDEAGFDVDAEMGVGYGVESLFVGPQYEFNRKSKYESDDMCGWGASLSGYAGKQVAGNTFDYVSRHAAAILAAGYPVCSASVDAYVAGRTAAGPFAIDLLCGKQTQTPNGRGALPDRYHLLPSGLKDALAASTAAGTNLIVSGAYLTREFNDNIYDKSRKELILSQEDSTYRAEGIKFCKEVLGYAAGSRRPYYEPSIKLADPVKGWAKSVTMHFPTDPNPETYPVQGAVSLKHTGKNSKVIARFDSDKAAAVIGEMNGYKTACFAIPLETIIEPEALEKAFAESLEYFRN